MAFWYSVALSRRRASLRPGSGLDAAARSSSVSRYEVRLTYDAWSGRGRPAGGIIPARSFVTTFSQTSAPSPTFARSIVSSASPAVRRVSLWQDTQY